MLLGDGLAGKTSLQRGLASGGQPRPTSYDARTIQLDISRLTLFEGCDDECSFSVWDLGGQVDYAAAQQPYIAPGSLYVLVVPATRATDDQYEEVLGRWLTYLQAGAPAAYVLPVVTQCDVLQQRANAAAGSAAGTRTGSAGTSTGSAGEGSCSALDAAAAEAVQWVRRKIYWHHCRLGQGATRLRFHDTIPCVSSVAGGEPSLRRMRATLEDIARRQPPPLSALGQVIPRSWGYACSMLRALRDGCDAEKLARWHEKRERQQQQQQQQQGGGRATRGKAEPRPTAFKSLARPYITSAEAAQMWTSRLAPALGTPTDARVLYDALQLLVNQGEVFGNASAPPPPS